MKKTEIAKKTDDPLILDGLAKDKNHNVRAFVACNKHTSLKTLKKLANDKSFSVRIMTYGNPNYKSDNLYIKFKK